MKRPIAVLLLVAAAATAVAVAAVRADAPPPAVGAADAVVRVGDASISADGFARRLATYLQRTGRSDGPAARQAFLEHVVNHLLLVHDAARAGMDATDAYRREAAALEEKLLVEALFSRVVYDTVAVTDEDLAALFERVNTQIEARHLYARTREAADALAARLAAGASFEALARATFADPVLAASGGAVGPFSFDEMDPAFEDAAFALKVGETSAPVRTTQGYSIVRVDARRTLPTVSPADFAARRDAFAAYVRSRKEQHARHALRRRLEARLDLRFDAGSVDRLFGQVTGRTLTDAAGEDAAWQGGGLVTFTDGSGARRTWTVADFRARAARTSEEQRAAVRTRDDLVGFAGGLVVREALVAEARAHGLHADATFAQAREQALGDWLAARARERVMASVEIPEDTLRAAFARRAGRYVHPEQVRVHEILADTRAALDALRPAVSASSFEAVAREHTRRAGSDGDLGWLDRDALGALAGPVFAAGEGEVVGPFEVAGRYVLLRAGARRAARPMTYEAARDAVRADLLRAAQAAALRDHLAALRARYDVHVDAAAAAAVRLPA